MYCIFVTNITYHSIYEIYDDNLLLKNKIFTNKFKKNYLKTIIDSINPII